MALKPIPDPVSIGEIKDIGMRYQDTQDRALFFILYLTGARISEALDLRIRDLDLQDLPQVGEIFKVHLLTRKNKKKMVRDIPVVIGETEREMVDIIFRHIEGLPSSQDEAKIFSYTSTDDAYYYIRKQSLTVRAMKGREIMERFRFKIHPHYLRHCRLTHLVQIYGMSETHLTQFAGWTDSRPAQIYVNLNWTSLVQSMIRRKDG